jgi:hypothetical protein
MRFISIVALLVSLAPLTSAAAEGPGRHGLIPKAMNVAAPEWRRPIPLTADSGRFSGEFATREFPIYLTPSEAARPATLRLVYENAVSVMPETSRLTIKVNDRLIGENVLQAAGDATTFSVAVPPGVLEPGFNSVRVTVHQTHRVDCSREASFELWTQLVPYDSEIVFSGQPGEIRDVRDLAAVKPARDGSTRIRVRTARSLDPKSMNRLSQAVQAAVLIGHFSHPQVDIAPEKGEGDGLDLIVDTDTAFESLTGTRPQGRGPQIEVSHDAQTGRVTLAVTGQTEADVQQALAQLRALAATAELRGSASGSRALRNVNGLRLEGGQEISLGELGFVSDAFTGRFYRQSARLLLPSDLFSADYDRVILSVDAAYAPDLASTSKLTVRVNGAIVTNFPLSKTSGDTLRQRALNLPLGAFKPGLNILDIEAETQTEADASCEPAALVSQRERFLVASSSVLTVPTLARIGTAPEISSLIAGGLGPLSAPEDLHVFVPKARLEALEASLGLFAKIAAVSGRESSVSFTFDRPSDEIAHVLAIGAYQDVPEALANKAGLDSDVLREAWKSPAPAPAPVSSLPGPIQVASAGGPIEVGLRHAGVTATSALPSLNAPSSGLARKLKESEILTQVNAALGRLAAMTGLNLELLRIEQPEAVVLPPVSPASTLVVAQGVTEKTLKPGWINAILPEVSTTTVILAPTPELLAQSVSGLITGSLWERFGGKVAAYERDGAGLRTTTGSETWLIPTESLSVQNVRLIAAGWLARNSSIYLAILFGVLVVLTVVSYRVLRTSGVREQ